MSKITCCNCNETLGIISLKFSKDELSSYLITKQPKVAAMSSDDRLCHKCQKLFHKELRIKQEEIQSKINKTIPEPELLWDKQTESSSVSATISGIIIMISSVALLFLIPDFLPKIIGFIITLLLGWGLTKLGSRRVLTNPNDILKRIMALENDNDNKILKEMSDEEKN